MPFFINEKAKIDTKEIDDLGNLISREADKYLKHTMKLNDIDYVFLKSILYVEDLIEEINKNIYGKSSNEMLGKKIEKIKLIQGNNTLSESIEYLEKIKKFRDKIAHDFYYVLEEDLNFLEEFKITSADDVNSKKNKIAEHFIKVVHGFLYVKLGLQFIDEFIYFKK